MKSEFSRTWNKSKQPRKQRKYLANAPLHLRQKLLSTMLDKPLKTKHNRNSLEIRKNDEVKIMRGKFAKKTGKILIIDRKNVRVQIDGINRTKKDGEKVPVWFHPSSLKITKIEDSDKKRLKTKEVKSSPKASPKKVEEKPVTQEIKTKQLRDASSPSKGEDQKGTLRSTSEASKEE